MPDSGTHNPMKRGSASGPMRIAVRTGTRRSPTLVLRARSKVWPGPGAPQLVAPVVPGARRMEVIIPRCAGLDVHKPTIGAGGRRLEPTARIEQNVGTFGTRTAELL